MAQAGQDLAGEKADEAVAWVQHAEAGGKRLVDATVATARWWEVAFQRQRTEEAEERAERAEAKAARLRVARRWWRRKAAKEADEADKARWVAAGARAAAAAAVAAAGPIVLD